MVDKPMIADAYRAYAYFRWVDDFIDLHSSTKNERVAFLQRQTELINRIYRKRECADLLVQEEMLADLINNCRDQKGRLQSYIRNMLAIIHFDTHRRGHLISTKELSWYSDTLGKAVVDVIQHFIGNRCQYPDTEHRTHAAIGAHIAHMLRDTFEDTSAGFINIPREYLEVHQIQPTDYESDAYRAWVKERVRLAWVNIESGKRYFNSIESLRCRIVGNWYCVRFDNILHAIEREDYLLRAEYPERKNLSSWSRMAWLGITLPIRHILSNGKAA